MNSPNANKPSSGPYVYDATVRRLSITLLESTYLKIIIVISSSKLISKCTFFLFFLLIFVFLLIPRKSTQNDVVSEVNALSALLYAAAIRPRIKLIPNKIPSSLFKAISGNNRSVLISFPNVT